MNRVVRKREDIQKLGKILGVWAHPDDEVYSMAGILAIAAKNGQQVLCITATRGEAGVQDEGRWPASELARVRTEEQTAAFRVLGIPKAHMLDYPDGACATVDENEVTNTIASLIVSFQPDSIFTFGPDGLTGHSDHQTVSKWARLAAQKAGTAAAIYHVVHTPEQYAHMQEADKHLNVYFNIEEPPLMEGCDCAICFTLPQDIYEQKIAALRAMPSQTEAMLEKFSHVLPKAVGVEAFRLYED
jgi:LmbE family N-acetylglucosaminyl deacetylase